MQRDLRGTKLYCEIRDEHYAAMLAPGFGRFSSALDLCANSAGDRIALSGNVLDQLAGLPRSNIAIVDCNGAVAPKPATTLYSDRAPRWQPHSERIAFLSDRIAPGIFDVFATSDGDFENAKPFATTDGIVEECAWSPNGRTLAISTAGLAADLAGASGSGTTAHGDTTHLPAWIPDVEESTPANAWRRLWLHDVESGTTKRIGSDDINVWEAAWCGDEMLAIIASDDPREGAWHDATLQLIDVRSAATRTRYVSDVEIGYPSGSPDGRNLALIEAASSDRTVLAGNLLLGSLDGDTPLRTIDTFGVDITYCWWFDAHRLFAIGLRGFETVALEHDIRSATTTVRWTSLETGGRRHPQAWKCGSDAFVLALESYGRYPAIALVEHHEPRIVCDLAHGGSAYIASVRGSLEEVSWPARDGLRIDGYLVTPPLPGPHPLVVLIHGGPVAAFRNQWSMFYAFTPLFVKYGYAVLHPNPRGSAGRGQAFARMVRGDMLGEDTYDFICGVEYLAEAGRIDKDRVGVTGGSYGGEMAGWLITQTDMFACAIPVSPVNDNISQHYTSNIPRFDSIFFGGAPFAGGKHLERSAIAHAHKASTPTLHMTGGLDRCTPPTQALEFHRALLEAGVESELVTYPLEGHGVRDIEAQIDQCTRMLTWLGRYMPANV